MRILLSSFFTPCRSAATLLRANLGFLKMIRQRANTLLWSNIDAEASAKEQY